MEANAEPQTPLPKERFSVGDTVHVFHGTTPGIAGYKTVAYIGVVVGFDDETGKWLVSFAFFCFTSYLSKRCYYMSCCLVCLTSIVLLLCNVGSELCVGKTRATQSGR